MNISKNKIDQILEILETPREVKYLTEQEKLRIIFSLVDASLGQYEVAYSESKEKQEKELLH